MANNDNRGVLASTGETKRGGYDGMVVDKILARDRRRRNKENNRG